MTDKSNKKLHGIYAEFDSVDTLLPACRKVRDAGYTKTDAFTPFPVHGIDKALGIKPTALPWIVLACGLTGTTIAVLMQVWMNTIDYPYIISGKPFFSMPAFIPVSFELTILLSAFGAFFGMLALNGLPKFSNPVFTSPRFDRVTDDKFFLYIDSADPRFDAKGVSHLLSEAGGRELQEVYEDDSETSVPKWVIGVVGALALLSLIPLLIAARMRVTNSSKPRFHVFYDMDFSPAKDAQVTTSLFADGRAARPDVPGTVAVGQFDEELDFYTGIDMEALSKVDSGRAGRLVRAMLYPDDPANPSDPPKADEKPADPPKAEETPSEQPKADDKPADDKPADDKPADDKPADDKPADDKPADDKPADDKPADDKPADDKPAETAPAADKPEEETKPAAEPAAEKKPEPAAAASPAPVASPSAPAANAQAKDTTPWLKSNPLEISEEVLMRGRAQFEIYCVTCHGNDGRGNGLVNRRAQKILASAWVQPSSLHQETLYSEAYPDGKLFSTISNGIRKMPGYASQIKVRDRWAIVAYVRALQASQNASIEDIPADRRDELNKFKGEIEAKLAAAAEAERKKAEEAAKKKAEEDAKATK